MLRIDTFSDIACPWCYIAEKRLGAVLAAEGLASEDLSVSGDGASGNSASSDRTPLVERYWQPFLLDPTIPDGGEPWAAFSARKFGSPARAATLFDAVARAGQEEGIAFDFTRMPKAPQTRRAHRLILAAGDRGHAMAMRLFAAYFEESADITDAAVLERLAADVGVDAAPVLTGDAFDADVDVALAAAQRLGITGVPLVVFNRRLAVSGAQPAAVFRQALTDAARTPV